MINQSDDTKYLIDQSNKIKYSIDQCDKKTVIKVFSTNFEKTNKAFLPEVHTVVCFY